MLYCIMRNRRISNTRLYVDLWNKEYSVGIELSLIFRTPKQLHRMIAYLTPMIITGSLVSDNEILIQYNLIIRGANNEQTNGIR